MLDAIRHACTRHGIPALFYSDNGPGYKNEMMTGAAIGMFAKLGIDHTTSLPYNSQASRQDPIRYEYHRVNIREATPGQAGRQVNVNAGLGMGGGVW